MQSHAQLIRTSVAVVVLLGFGLSVEGHQPKVTVGSLNGRRRSWATFPEPKALRETFSHPAYLAGLLVLSAVIAFAYLLLLPSIALDVTPRYFGLWVLSYLTPTEEVIAGGMGVLVSLSVVLNLYLWRTRTCRPSTPAAAGVVAGVALNAMASMICCGILVPLILSLFASGAALVGSISSVRSFFSTYYLALYILSFATLVGSIHLTSLRFPFRAAGQEEGSTTGTGTPGTVDTSASGGRVVSEGG